MAAGGSMKTRQIKRISVLESAQERDFSELIVSLEDNIKTKRRKPNDGRLKVKAGNHFKNLASRNSVRAEMPEEAKKEEMLVALHEFLFPGGYFGGRLLYDGYDNETRRAAS